MVEWWPWRRLVDRENHDRRRSWWWSPSRLDDSWIELLAQKRSTTSRRVAGVWWAVSIAWTVISLGAAIASTSQICVHYAWDLNPCYDLRFALTSYAVCVGHIAYGGWQLHVWSARSPVALLALALLRMVATLILGRFGLKYLPGIFKKWLIGLHPLRGLFRHFVRMAVSSGAYVFFSYQWNTLVRCHQRRCLLRRSCVWWQLEAGRICLK